MTPVDPLQHYGSIPLHSHQKSLSSSLPLPPATLHAAGSLPPGLVQLLHDLSCDEAPPHPLGMSYGSRFYSPPQELFPPCMSPIIPLYELCCPDQSHALQELEPSLPPPVAPLDIVCGCILPQFGDNLPGEVCPVATLNNPCGGVEPDQPLLVSLQPPPHVLLYLRKLFRILVQAKVVFLLEAIDDLVVLLKTCLSRIGHNSHSALPSIKHRTSAIATVFAYPLTNPLACTLACAGRQSRPSHIYCKFVPSAVFLGNLFLVGKICVPVNSVVLVQDRALLLVEVAKFANHPVYELILKVHAVDRIGVQALGFERLPSPRTCIHF
mmetsp:Transcript_2295/g.4719  ORF Transcript_2295/g.4719 Transcript_2295/m.4719 type:complete len:324 (-) Transcript_2295:2947-3918(-)